ncbi:MAG TPA: hypothetical protein PLQ52_04015 [Lacunisphaera sp.]|jgi:hypothetical protein|nr:hypothetical protein [Lacunisphaera sp.]HQY05208.1 hypothetical protein [Lacunisphaera sp.]
MKTWPIPSWVPHKQATDCEGAEERWARTMKREGAKCIYCDLDLVSSVELLLSAELDHLVPKEAFRSPEKKGFTKDGDYRTNLVFCCGPCNDSKGNWPLSLPEAEAREMLALNRDTYLEIAKKYTVGRRRSEEKRVAKLMAKAWAQRATKLGAHKT